MGGERHTLAALPTGKRHGPIVQEVGWASGPVWTGAENLTPTGIRFPDRPARSKSLYRLSYPVLQLTEDKKQFIKRFVDRASCNYSW